MIFAVPAAVSPQVFLYGWRNKRNKPSLFLRWFIWWRRRDFLALRLDALRDSPLDCRFAHSRFACRLALAGALCSNPSPDFASYKKINHRFFCDGLFGGEGGISSRFAWTRCATVHWTVASPTPASPAGSRSRERFVRIPLLTLHPIKKINHRFFCDGLFGGEGGISSRFAWTRCATVHWTVALPTPASPAGSRSRERFVRIPLLTLHPIKKINHRFFCDGLFGGEGGIRTLAPVSRPTPLAGAPLRPA